MGKDDYDDVSVHYGCFTLDKCAGTGTWLGSNGETEMYTQYFCDETQTATGNALPLRTDETQIDEVFDEYGAIC